MNYLHLKEGLKSIFQSYEVFIIDLWGVIHNGIILHESSIEVLENLNKYNKQFFLVSNAPRPKKSVSKFLKKLHMDTKYFKHIFTSGDAALEALKLRKFGSKFFHMGPPRDFDLFLKFNKDQVKEIQKSDYILCTGLFEKHSNNLNYYKLFLKKYIDKKMICTNPDLVVHRGNKEEYCAGSIAKIFENIGGTVIYYGKPYPEIYNQCVINNKKVLAIGDNLNTDIKGANLMNFDSLFILNGIHKKLFTLNSNQKLKETLKKFNLNINYYQKQLKW